MDSELDAMRDCHADASPESRARRDFCPICCYKRADTFISHSGAGGEGWGMGLRSRIVLALGFCALGLGAPAGSRASEVEGHSGVKRACLAPSETREEIKARHLLEPFAVLKSAAAQFKAEALSAKLCHLGDELVYEIALLHRDGRLVHVVMNAATGKLLGARNAREPMPKI